MLDLFVNCFDLWTIHKYFMTNKERGEREREEKSLSEICPRACYDVRFTNRCSVKKKRFRKVYGEIAEGVINIRHAHFV